VLGVPESRLRLVPPLIDPSELFGKDRAPGFDEPVFRVGTLARLIDEKGIDDLLEAAVRLRDAGRDVRWFVCGTSEDPVPFLRRAQRAGLESTFTFLGERGDRGALFMTWDCYVQPSREDGLPVALIEAMAAGVPAVACRNPSLDAALVDSGVRCVPPRNPSALADAVAATLDDSMPEREQRRAASRQAAARLGRLETSVVALHDLYEEVVAEARARGR
jgi:glycosyltransferase involved in cell wall biosynthesis